MEYLSVDAVSFNQLIVTVALGLFVTMIFFSIYIRIQRQYRGRNTLPNHTQKHGVFGKVRSRDANLPSIPTENHEVVTGARPKAPVKDEFEGFQFDFEVPQKPTGPIEHVAVRETEDFAPLDRWEEPAEATVDGMSEANGNDTDQPEYDENLEDEYFSVPDVSFPVNGEVATNGTDDIDDVDVDMVHSDIWESSDNDEYLDDGTGEICSEGDTAEELTNSEIAQNDDQDAEYQLGSGVAQSSAYDDEIPPEEYLAAEDLPVENYEDHEVEQPIETEPEEAVVPFDLRTVEAKRVGTPPEETNRSLSVVSVCLISDDQEQIYRDIRGEYLDAFLNKRGFIYLDEEYHLKHKSTVDKGAIRVRNYEAMSIGDLVKENQETCGFRLYFRPRDCADALATLNEMLKIANLAKSFFANVCAKPLRIYDGRKDITGKISPFTQEDYNALKRDLDAAFPRSPEAASKRTAVTRNEYAPSEDLPTRAEQY
ncbi:MAG: hypothetical protein OXG05_10330 [Gammaproteobacteria bacterium]|nr:hypothetical protein [Gammaproteobacteria bacterium]